MGSRRGLLLHIRQTMDCECSLYSSRFENLRVDARKADDYAKSLHDRHLHLAISDGVGGWGDTVDPSLFPQVLMYQYSQRADRRPSSHPRQIVEEGYEGVIKAEEVPAGGATICAIALDGEGRLRGVK